MNQQILRQIQASPEAQQAVSDAVQQLINDPDITPEVVAQLIQIVESVDGNPDAYAQVRQMLLQSGAIDPEDLPEQYDEVVMTVLLIALKLVQQHFESGPAFARGGLNDIARQGRGGDTMLAHVNPEEARLLMAMGGSGTINPHTGLPEFLSLKKIVKSVGKAVKSVARALGPALPVVLNIVAPGLGGAIGSALGASGMFGSVLGNALLGGATSALGGGDPLKGAVLGGLGGGLGSMAGSAANSALGLNLGAAGQSILGSGLVGGLAGAASGQGFAQGALQGAGGAYLGGQLGSTGASGALGAGLKAAGSNFGNMMAAGYSPTESARGGALAGLVAGFRAPPTPSKYDLAPQDSGGLGLKAPSDLAVDTLKAPALNTAGVPAAGLGMTYDLTAPNSMTYKGPESLSADYSMYGAANAPTASAQPELGTGMSVAPSPLNAIAEQSAQPAPKGSGMGSVMNALPLLGLLGSAQTPQQIQQAVQTMSPQQQEYFSRPLQTMDWNKIQQEAQMANMGLGEYVASRWNNITQDPNYATQAAVPGVTKMAEGGPVSGSSLMQRLRLAATNSSQSEIPNEQNSAGNITPVSGYLGELGRRLASNQPTATPPEQQTALTPSMSQFRRAIMKATSASAPTPTPAHQPMPLFDWGAIQRAANLANMELGEYVANNWGVPQGRPMAEGGFLSRLAQGGGSGRADTINARLSDGEYVMDAETVALLGDGSTKEGARRLDDMRAQLRKQKGRALSKGQFSPDAKSPLQYLKKGRV